MTAVVDRSGEFNEGDPVRVVCPGPVPAGWEGYLVDWDAVGLTLLTRNANGDERLMFFPWAMGCYVVKEVTDA